MKLVNRILISLIGFSFSSTILLAEPVKELKTVHTFSSLIVKVGANNQICQRLASALSGNVFTLVSPIPVEPNADISISTTATSSRGTIKNFMYREVGHLYNKQNQSLQGTALMHGSFLDKTVSTLPVNIFVLAHFDYNEKANPQFKVPVIIFTEKGQCELQGTEVPNSETVQMLTSVLRKFNS